MSTPSDTAPPRELRVPPAGEAIEVAFARMVVEALHLDGAALVIPHEAAPELLACWPPAAGATLLELAAEAADRTAEVPGATWWRRAGEDRHAVALRILPRRSPAAVLVGLGAPGAPLPGDEAGRLLETFAEVGARALEVIAEREAARAARDRTALLVEAGLVIAAGLELRDVLARLVDVSRRVLGARYAALGVLDEERTALSDFIWSGLSDAEARRIGDLPQGRGILGVLIRDAAPLRIDRISDDPRSVGFPPGHPPMESFLGVPVVLDGVALGNLYLTEKEGGGPFSEEDEQIALTLAAQAAVAVDKARRYEREHRRVAQLESVQEVAAAMLRTLDLETLLPLVARRARQLTGADAVAVGLVDGSDLSVRFADGEAAPALEGLRLRMGDGRVAQQLCAAAQVPRAELVWLELAGQPVGILAALGRRAFDEDDRRLLETFSSQAAIAVANAQEFAAERHRLLASAEVAAARARERSAEEGLRRAIAAQEAERARIARELHDEAGQVLTALALQLRALEDHVDDRGREQLAAARGLVTGAAASLRSLATELRPSGLREHGLAAAIRRQADRVRDATGIHVDLAIDDLPEGLPEEVETTVFRVVQEALTNVARHSGAGRASVLASVRGGRMRVVVEDDGRGFDPSAPTGRLGLAGMRERMELVGGELQIESAPGTGTTVIIELGAAT